MHIFLCRRHAGGREPSPPAPGRAEPQTLVSLDGIEVAQPTGRFSTRQTHAGEAAAGQMTEPPRPRPRNDVHRRGQQPELEDHGQHADQTRASPATIVSRWLRDERRAAHVRVPSSTPVAKTPPSRTAEPQTRRRARRGGPARAAARSRRSTQPLWQGQCSRPCSPDSGITGHRTGACTSGRTRRTGPATCARERRSLPSAGSRTPSSPRPESRRQRRSAPPEAARGTASNAEPHDPELADDESQAGEAQKLREVPDAIETRRRASRSETALSSGCSASLRPSGYAERRSGSSMSRRRPDAARAGGRAPDPADVADRVRRRRPVFQVDGFMVSRTCSSPAPPTSHPTLTKSSTDEPEEDLVAELVREATELESDHDELPPLANTVAVQEMIPARITPELVRPCSTCTRPSGSNGRARRAS